MLRGFVALAALAALGASARADNATPPTLPSLALNPQAPDPSMSSPWTGLYVGSELSASFAKGVKGGRFGGAAYAGYNREFDNNLVLGVDAKAGYAPSMFAHGPRGFNFAETDVKVGYDMGRLMPYVTAGVALAKPNQWGVPAYTGATDAMNNLFSSGDGLRGIGTVGAGVDYAINNNLTVGVAVSVSHGNAAIAP
jgi:outer membrane immunogenic protein